MVGVPTPDRPSREAVLDLLVRLHGAPDEALHRARQDDLTVPGRAGLERLLRDRSGPWDNGPFAEPARRLLDHSGGPIIDALARHDRLADGVRANRDRWVVTHGEPHRANTIETADGVVIVDWDTAAVAPPERDLWWLVAEDDTVTGTYEHRTGVAVDPGALELYRVGWFLGDVAAFIDQLHRRPVDDADTRTSWEALVRCVTHLGADAMDTGDSPHR